MVSIKYLIFSALILGMLAVTDVAARKKGRRGHRPSVPYQGYPLPIHQQNYVSPTYGVPIQQQYPAASPPLRQLAAPIQRPNVQQRPIVTFGVGPNQLPQAYSSYSGAVKPTGQFLPQLAYIPPPTAQFPIRIQPAVAPKPIYHQQAQQVQPARPAVAYPKPVQQQQQQARPAKPQYPQPLPIKPIHQRPTAPSQSPVKLSYQQQTTPTSYATLPTPVPIPAPETVPKPEYSTPTWPINPNEGPLISAYAGKLPDTVPVYISPSLSTVYGSAYIDPSPSVYPALPAESSTPSAVVASVYQVEEDKATESSPAQVNVAPTVYETEKQQTQPTVAPATATYSAPELHSDDDSSKEDLTPKVEEIKPVTPSYTAATESNKKIESYLEKPATESSKVKGEANKPVHYPVVESGKKTESHPKKPASDEYYSKGEESKPSSASTHSAPASYKNEEPDASSYELTTTATQEYPSTTAATTKHPEPTSKPYSKAPSVSKAASENLYKAPSKAKSAPVKASALPVKAPKPYVRPDSKLKPYTPPVKATTAKPSQYSTESTTTTTKKPLYTRIPNKDIKKQYTTTSQPESSTFASSVTPSTSRPSYKPPSSNGVTSAPASADKYPKATRKPVQTPYFGATSLKVTTKAPQAAPVESDQAQTQVTSDNIKPVANTYQKQEESAKYPAAEKQSPSVEPVDAAPVESGSEYTTIPSAGQSEYDVQSPADDTVVDTDDYPVVGQSESEKESVGDYSAIPGEPDVDYPILSELPKSQFNCSEQSFPGYYADVSARCQVFHVCWDDRQWSFLCPNGTIFSQEHFVCVWWHEFECSQAPSLYNLNEQLYQVTSASSAQPITGYEEEQKSKVVDAPVESGNKSDSKDGKTY